MNFKWYGQSGFKIEINDKNIIVDPYGISNETVKADFILITHSHFDHLSVDDIKKVIKQETVIICPEDSEEQIKNQFPNKIYIVKPDMKLKFKNIIIKTVPAYNINKSFHPKSNNWVGYIIESQGESVYHTGDTDFIPEMKKLKLNTVLLPVGGTYTMNAEEAADMVNTINPDKVIPMHYGTVVGTDEDAEIFKSKVKNAEVIILNRE
jgi:L-ascorbate metabolism protein UlaG (beta-lactamase superfamily)